MSRKINSMIDEIAHLEYDRAWCMGDAMYGMLGQRIAHLKKELRAIIAVEIQSRIEQKNARSN